MMFVICHSDNKEYRGGFYGSKLFQKILPPKENRPKDVPKIRKKDLRHLLRYLVDVARGDTMEARVSLEAIAKDTGISRSRLCNVTGKDGKVYDGLLAVLENLGAITIQKDLVKHGKYHTIETRYDVSAWFFCLSKK